MTAGDVFHLLSLQQERPSIPSIKILDSDVTITGGSGNVTVTALSNFLMQPNRNYAWLYYLLIDEFYVRTTGVGEVALALPGTPTYIYNSYHFPDAGVNDATNANNAAIGATQDGAISTLWGARVTGFGKTPTAGLTTLTAIDNGSNTWVLSAGSWAMMMEVAA